MRVPSIDSAAILAALDKRDPETLVGPTLCLLTWMARDVPPRRMSRTPRARPRAYANAWSRTWARWRRTPPCRSSFA